MASTARRRAFEIASVQEGDSRNGGNNGIGALELNAVFEDLQPEIAFKDPPSLPSKSLSLCPTSLVRLTCLVCGSRTRVFRVHTGLCFHRGGPDSKCASIKFGDRMPQDALKGSATGPLVPRWRWSDVLTCG
ncbi:uncharacterized protein LOC120112948 [Phoenix dactylifera]|uniref:Uncharacterized protein LOC120112948 n=1 Tax=Phoenix dactylifera TaxID=42345 RepID=A0A8B9B060_PHODC|nr:uncharacterized protein LOC120112948 [Phoenix dactylifera]